jgi:hypothetical protein
LSALGQRLLRSDRPELAGYCRMSPWIPVAAVFAAEMWLAIGFGLVVGLATLWTLGRWVRFIGGLRQDSVLAGERQKPQHRIMGIPLLGFAQPTPWLVIIGLPYAA